LKTAVLLGDIDRGQAKVTGFLDKAARNREILRLNLIRDRNDLIQGKLCRRLRDLAMLLGEVFRKETISGSRIRDKETSARDDLLVGRNWGRYSSHCCSLLNLVDRFKYSGGTHTATNTHRHHAVLRIAPRHLAHQCRRQLRTGASQWMA